MKKMFNIILQVASVIILICSIVNICIYYKDVRVLQSLNKEKLKLEIKLLKQKNNEDIKK